MLGAYVILGAVKPGSWSSRGVIAAWTLYDFANSAFSAVIQSSVYGPYYAGAVVGNESGRGDLLWGALVSLSMIIVALSSPVLGGIADHGGFRKRFLATFTLVSVGFAQTAAPARADTCTTANSTMLSAIENPSVFDANTAEK